MEKVLHPYDKERMRLAMLKHEETFREQVHELHRLYRIQKMLMGSTGLGSKHQQPKQDRFFVETKNKPLEIISHQNYAQQINGDSKFKNNIMVKGLVNQQLDDQARSNGQEHNPKSNSNALDENELELTLSLGPSAPNPRQRRTDGSESGQSFSSSSTGSTQTRKTSPKNRISTRKEDSFTWGTMHTNSNSSFPQGSETQPGFPNGQQTNPPWICHALSLKLT